MPTFASAVDWMGRRMRGISVGASAFVGAQVNRLTADWILAPMASADRELRGDLLTLRVRSRELGRNNPYAVRFLGLLEENVVGPRGIRMEARVLDSQGNPNESVNQRIESSWREWCRPENASVDGRLSWADIERLAITTVAQDGEFLARMVEGANNEFGFAIQVLDVDQLDIQYDRAARGDQNEIRMGVEVDGWGKPVAYHVFKRHPHDYLAIPGPHDRERIPASQIVHLYRSRRTGQTRGVPWFAPVMMPLRMLAGYQEAELVNARTSAAKGGFFVPDPKGALDPTTAGGARRRTKMRAEPGLFGWLPEGATDFKPWSPEHPSSAFDPFNTTILRSVGTGLRSSYSAISGDITKTSYSSIRQGTLADRDVYCLLQWWLIEHLNERVRPRQLAWSLTTGKLRIEMMTFAELEAHEWIPRGWEWVDPLKEVLAIEKACELVIDSRTRAAGARGRDFGDNVADRVRELRAMERAGLTESEGKTSASVTLVLNDDDPEDGDEEFGGRLGAYSSEPLENGNGR